MNNLAELKPDIKISINQIFGIETNMKFHNVLLTGMLEVEKEMSSSVWKRKTTKLKRAGK